MKVTLDRNCIIALENDEPEAPALRQLVAFHNVGKISLRVTAISIAERERKGAPPQYIEEFKQRIEAIGLGTIEIFPTLAYLGLAIVGWCYPAGEETAVFERKIHEILFPTTEFSYTDYCKRLGIDPTEDEVDRKWRNRKCDVLTMWGHIRFEGDIFITSDRNFHRESRKPKLIALGAGQILTPQEAVAFLNSIIP